MLLATDTGQSLYHPLLMLIGLLATIALLILAGLTRRRNKHRNKWRHRSVGLFAGATACYTYGLLRTFRLETGYHNCTYERYGQFDGFRLPELVSSTDSLFPISSVCSWKDGVTIDIVPWYVNPALIAFLAAATACAATAVYQGRNGRHMRTDKENNI
ncbi:hypothetical protein NOGI109294_17915 [Nocardiopsis gilva]|uniref:hypothetical protein n=1 Tax=Nocardiopsis gilva TaxID=280236 RepID=UPI00126968A4|nr:hypothetical protein [Nocardiopsis gilva]